MYMYVYTFMYFCKRVDLFTICVCIDLFVSGVAAEYITVV